MAAPLAIGLAIGRFLFAGTQWFAGAEALGNAIQEAGKSLDSEDFEFLCKYRGEIETAMDLFKTRVEVGVNRAHWSAFAYSSPPSIYEAVRARSSVIRDLNQGNITGLALYALNYHKDYAITTNSSGENVPEPPGLWPGTQSQRDRVQIDTDGDGLPDEFFYSEQPQFDEDRPQAMWDGGTLMVSRPVRRERSMAEPDPEFEEFLARARENPVELNTYEEEASLDDEYYSIPPSWTESSRTSSREWFADPFYGPTVLRGMCSHMDARVMLLICGALDPLFQNAAAAALRGEYNDDIFGFERELTQAAGLTDAGQAIMASPDQNRLARVAEIISQTGFNTRGTGILNIIADKNELTASSLPLVDPIASVGTDLWNGAYGFLDATLVGYAPDALYVGDQCGKDPCDLG